MAEVEIAAEDIVAEDTKILSGDSDKKDKESVETEELTQNCCKVFGCIATCFGWITSKAIGCSDWYENMPCSCRCKKDKTFNIGGDLKFGDQDESPKGPEKDNVDTLSPTEVVSQQPSESKGHGDFTYIDESRDKNCKTFIGANNFGVPEGIALGARRVERRTQNENSVTRVGGNTLYK